MTELERLKKLEWLTELAAELRAEVAVTLVKATELLM